MKVIFDIQSPHDVNLWEILGRLTGQSDFSIEVPLDGKSTLFVEARLLSVEPSTFTSEQKEAMKRWQGVKIGD